METTPSYDTRMYVRISSTDFRHVSTNAQLLEMSTADYARMLLTTPIELVTSRDAEVLLANSDSALHLTICDLPTYMHYRRIMSSWKNLLAQIDDTMGRFSVKHTYPEERRNELSASLDNALDLTKEYRKKLSRYYSRKLLPIYKSPPKVEKLSKRIELRIRNNEKDYVFENAKTFKMKPSRFVRNVICLPLSYAKRLHAIHNSALLSANIEPKILCSKLVLDELVELMRVHGHALSRSARGFHTLRIKPGMRAQTRRDTYEGAIGELQVIHEYAPKYDRLLALLNDQYVYMLR